MTFSEKILVPLFIVVLKTKRIAKSAVHGKLNHKVKQVFPYAVGSMIAAWTWFIYLI